MSFDYYDQNAKQFFASTFAVNMSDIYSRFLGRLPQGSRILDMGCGSGRDALYFHNQGHIVEAFDASLEMVKLASEATALNVKHCTFQNYNPVSFFNGIWACASLLHLPKKEHQAIILKYYKTLNSGGIFYMSFKYGADNYEKKGRHFSCYDEATMNELLGKSLTNYQSDIWVSGDVRKERQSEKWLNVLLTKEEIC